jgi:hypothetical protein
MKKLILFLLLLLIVGYLIWRWYNSGSDSAEAQAQLAYDRVWIDHLPTKEIDTVNVFAAITEQPIGVFDASSMWKGSFELFKYSGAKGDKVKLHFPQNGDQENVTLSAKSCREKSFDFCLEVGGTSRGVKRYYSQKGWEIGSASDGEAVRARVEALVHALPIAAE